MNKEDFCVIHGYEYMKSARGNPISYCAACESHNTTWNEAIDAAMHKAAIAIGVETLLATHVSYEINKLKK